VIRSLQRLIHLQAVQLEVRMFLLHCVSGVVVVALHWFVMWLLIRAHTDPLIATSAGFLAGALLRFYLSYRHIFEPSNSVKRSGFWFVVALGVQFLLNGLLFSGISSLFEHTWVAQALTTGALTVLNFLTYRLWVFR
jgi:putative flippase GtrA